mgnify:CR=1 FL=1
MGQGERLAGALQRLEPFAARLGALSADTRVQRRLRLGCAALLLLWCAQSLLRTLWALVPPVAPLPADLQPINPALPEETRGAVRPVPIEELLAAHLFGEPGAAALPESVTEAPAAPEPLTEAQAATALAGIEDGAAETRLPLLLRGVVAASEAGLGQAIIEHRRQQELYRVGDDLPVGDTVKLAKVMPTQVVISNRGRYELLRLFEEGEGDGMVVIDSAPAPAPRREPTAPVRESSPGRDGSRIASTYREQLYRDPQSLADVVRITAVRDDGDLLGYRVNPGRAAQEFSALGFRPGDLVTAVNGLPLSDPSNTVRLYQAMRSATEAVFDLQRGNERISLTVSLDGSTDQ